MLTFDCQVKSHDFFVFVLRDLKFYCLKGI